MNQWLVILDHNDKGHHNGTKTFHQLPYIPKLALSMGAHILQLMIFGGKKSLIYFKSVFNLCFHIIAGITDKCV